MDTTTAFRALRAYWYLVVIGALIAAGIAVYMNGSAPLRYEASGTYVVSPRANDTTGINDTIRTIDDARTRAIVGTYVEILSSTTVARDAAASLGLDPAVLDNYEIRAVALPEANIAELTLTGPDPLLVPELVDAVGTIGGQRFVGLYGIYDTIALDAPAVPDEPINRSPLLVGLLGAAAGVLAGAALALAIGAPRERRRREVMVRIDAYGDPGASVTPLPSAYDRRATGTG